MINEDRVQPGQGFGSPDSLGTGSIIRAGDVQRMSAGSSLGQPLDPQRRAWLQVARGDLALADLTLHTGDAVGLTAADALELRAVSDAELLLFDLPGAGA